jgi:hypothetical protein
MPAERLSMRQIRDVLRLHCAARLSQRATAASLGLSQGAVSGYLSRARAAGVSCPLPEDVDDARLEALLFPPPAGIPADQRPMPDWGWVHRELRRPDVTLARHCQLELFRAKAAESRAVGQTAAVALRQCASACDRKVRSVDRETR